MAMLLNTQSASFLFFLTPSGYRIAVYKAVYPTVGTMTDVIAAMDEVSVQ